MDELSFDGRKVIVTGAGRGIGRAYALLLASRGAHVAVADLGATTDGGGVETEDPASSVVTEITDAGGTAVAIRADVSVSDEAESIVKETLDAFGGLDAVINNAGIVSVGDFREIGPEEFQRHLDVHYFGTLNMARAAWPHLVDSGTGRLLNTVSAAMLGNPMMSHYGGSKGAVFGLTRNLALDGLQAGVKVNAIAPGASTRMSEASAASLSPEVLEYMRTALLPELVAPAAAYLVHPRCETTGEVFNVAGGFVNRMAIVNTAGVYDTAMTIETVAENWEAVMTVNEAAQPQIVAIPETPAEV